MSDVAARLAGQLREQARACETMGSPLYARLLEDSAGDVEQGGPCRRVLTPHDAPGRGNALALRFMAAMHRLVLTHQLPELAEHYPSVGGTPGASAWPRFRDAVEARTDELAALVTLPCQTNEVGRAAGLMFGFLWAANRWRLPLRIFEVGASAGLNLRFDRFRYAGGGAEWGPAGSPVDLTGLWSDPPWGIDASLTIAERRGSDRQPMSPTDPETALRLRSSVWADQRVRFDRLQGALTLAGGLPVPVDEAAAADWVAQQVGVRAGTCAVLYHSVVIEYLSEAETAGFRSAIESIGNAASEEAPFVWLRLEPISILRSHGITLTSWPGGDERHLATCGAHGTDVRRVTRVTGTL